MLNHDFIKLVLVEKKQLLALSEVKHVHMPKYEELSVKKLWPLVQGDAGFLVYFPDSFPEG